MSVPAAAIKQFISDMQNLNPGDVITNLNCKQCKDFKILVLDEVADGIHFSIGSEGICITPDLHGPFRLDFDDQCIVTKDGEIYDHLAPGVSVLKAGGMRELALYRRLPPFKKLRLNLNEKDLNRFFRDEPNVPMVLRALLDDAELSYLAGVEACMNYVFGNRPEPISRREMMLLTMAIRLITDNAMIVPVDIGAGARAGSGENPTSSFLVDNDPSSHIMQ